LYDLLTIMFASHVKSYLYKLIIPCSSRW